MSTCEHGVDDRALYSCVQCRNKTSKHIYRIALIGGQWRLMRDDKLHSTYGTQALAKAGMATEQARDEKRESGVPDVYGEGATYQGTMRARKCGKCDIPCVPYGVDWPYWHDGKPECFTCAYARAYAARKGE